MKTKGKFNIPHPIIAFVIVIEVLIKEDLFSSLTLRFSPSLSSDSSIKFLYSFEFEGSVSFADSDIEYGTDTLKFASSNNCNSEDFIIFQLLNNIFF